MLGTGSHRYHRQSPQYTAADLGDRRKEEREREKKKKKKLVFS